MRARRSTGAANPARELARQIGRTIPIIYGGGALGAVAAMRWKCDVNENAKAPAFWNTYPELDHNEICGWGQHGDVTRQLFTLVELRHGFEHQRLERRGSTRRARSSRRPCTRCSTVEAEGEGRLAQLLDLMYVGDWTSCYLALDNDVDPGPIDAIIQLKDRLAALSATGGSSGSATSVPQSGRAAIRLSPGDPGRLPRSWCVASRRAASAKEPFR